jgi:predicted RNase H-like HicB family nuclease
MKINLGVEDLEPRNWVAWVFEVPGCYARASTRGEAISSVPGALEEMLARLRQAEFLAFDGYRPPIDFVIAEEFRAFQSSPDYLVNAFFENDRIPLTVGDIVYARCLLDLNRRELLSVVSDVPVAARDKSIPGEAQQNINGILKHIGTAEWWYWDRLDMAFPRQERPDELFDLLTRVRDFTFTQLLGLVGDVRTTVRSGEQWSPRKVMRRTIWHERVHSLQIARYLKTL